MGLITPTWSPVAVEETGDITPTWSAVKVEETGEKKAILRTRKSRRIEAKGSEKRLFAKEDRLVIDLVSGDVTWQTMLSI
jgi:predicted FMN-binding regulatory protein PaiB